MLQSAVVILTQYLSPLDRLGTVRSVQYSLGGLLMGHCIFFFGGGDQDRTDYLLTASQALYQVSYAPVCILYDRLMSKSTPKTTPRVNCVVIM